MRKYRPIFMLSAISCMTPSSIGSHAEQYAQCSHKRSSRTALLVSCFCGKCTYLHEFRRDKLRKGRWILYSHVRVYSGIFERKVLKESPVNYVCLQMAISIDHYKTYLKVLYRSKANSSVAGFRVCAESNTGSTYVLELPIWIQVYHDTIVYHVYYVYTGGPEINTYPLIFASCT